MSKQTIIDWHSSGLYVATTSGRGPALERLSRQPISEEDSAAASNAMEALSRAAQELNVAKSPATVVASREMVEVRTVEVPRMDSQELPDVIRYQAQRQMANMSDNWTLDFVMLPENPGQEMQTALVGAVSPATMASVNQAVQAANLQLTHVVFAPLEVARYALAAGAASENASIVLCLSDSQCDLIIVQNGAVIQVRGTRLPAERESIPTVVKGEVRRSLLAGSKQLAGSTVDQVFVLATPAMVELVGQTLTEAAGAPVKAVDPAQLLPADIEDRDGVAAESPGRICALAGAAMLSSADKASVMDFADPKKRPAQKSNKPRYLLAGAAAIALLVAGFSWWIGVNRRLDEELAFYEQQIADKEVLVESARRKVSELAEIEAFLDRAPNFLDEFTYIARKIPSSEKVLLGGPFCSILADGRAQIQVPVAADEDSTISEFEESLRDDDHEVIRRDPQRIDGATGLYKWQTVETIRIANQGWQLLDENSDRESAESGETESRASDESAAADSSSDGQEQELGDDEAQHDEELKQEGAGEPLVPDENKQAAR